MSEVTENYPFLFDPAISLKAKGLLALIVSQPNLSDNKIDTLRTQAKDGINSIRSTIKELKRFGYCTHITLTKMSNKVVCCFLIGSYKPNDFDMAYITNFAKANQLKVRQSDIQRISDATGK